MIQLLSPAEAAERLGVSVNTLETWRCVKRYALAYIKVGGRVKYRPVDIDAFIASRRVTPGETKKPRRRRRAA